MVLSSFTVNHRRQLQHYLQLPIQAIREGSSLWQALEFVEQLDRDEGTTIAADVIARLGLLEDLDSVDGDTSSLGTAIRSQASQARRIDVYQEIEIELQQPRPGQRYGGEAAAIQAWMDKLTKDIRRDLGLSGQTKTNQINAVYPGGDSQHITRRPSYGTW